MRRGGPAARRRPDPLAFLQARATALRSTQKLALVLGPRLRQGRAQRPGLFDPGP